MVVVEVIMVEWMVFPENVLFQRHPASVPDWLTVVLFSSVRRRDVTSVSDCLPSLASPCCWANQTDNRQAGAARLNQTRQTQPGSVE